jgi:hypothetical protein
VTWSLLSDEKQKPSHPEATAYRKPIHNTENFLKNKNKDKYEKYTKLL